MVGDVSEDGFRFLGGGSFKDARRRIPYSDAAPFASESSGAGEADAASTAGDDGDVSVKFQFHGFLFMLQGGRACLR